jgi:hypothetical protein
MATKLRAEAAELEVPLADRFPYMNFEVS